MVNMTPTKQLPNESNCYSKMIEDIPRGSGNKKWGEQNHSPAVWCVILAEEVGELAKAILTEQDAQYKELVHVSAVCVAFG